MDMNKITVVGAGSWGTAIAVLLSNKNFNINLWGRSRSIVEGINNQRKNPVYLPELAIPASVTAYTDIEKSHFGSDMIIIAVPSHVMRKTIRAIKPFIGNNEIILSLTKGIENESNMTMSQVIEDESGIRKSLIAALSGPNHAEEVARNIPTATVIASEDEKTTLKLQNIFITSSFRVYTNSDILGVQLGGAIKNVIAIAAGVSDGLGFGDNTKASLITRGLAEMIRFGVALGANSETFSGLSGVGDLVGTCTSRYSRNRLVGEKLGKGYSLPEILKEMKMVAEGISTAKAIKNISINKNIELPICSEVFSLLYENKKPLDCVSDLMMRGATSENEKYKGGY